MKFQFQVEGLVVENLNLTNIALTIIIMFNLVKNKNYEKDNLSLTRERASLGLIMATVRLLAGATGNMVRNTLMQNNNINCLVLEQKITLINNLLENQSQMEIFLEISLQTSHVMLRDLVESLPSAAAHAHSIPPDIGKGQTFGET